MKSSSNQYFIGLDQLRAIAAYMVFCWHFLYANQNGVINYSYTSDIPFIALLLEGHIGVSLFMVLSGFLFARLLDNRKIDYLRFYLNRFLRLAPLMIFVVFINAVIKYLNNEPSIYYFFASLANGLVKPTLPNAGWSITAEFHFYLLIPFLLWARGRGAWLLIALILVFIGIRLWAHAELGTMRYLAYWTILGRIDLFIFGILAFHFRKYILSRPSSFWVALMLLAIVYWRFETMGGYMFTRNHQLWAYWAAVEGVFLSVIVVGYDRIAAGFSGLWSRFLALIGKISYSMYLMHIFFVFQMSSYINDHIVPLDNLLLALIFATLAFLAMIPIAFLSYHFVEKPFLSLRVRYLLDKK